MLYYPEKIKSPGKNKNTPQKTFITEQLPVTAFVYSNTTDFN